MKKYFILTLFVLFSVTSYAYTYTFDVYEVADRTYNDTTSQWSDWSEYRPFQVRVTINESKVYVYGVDNFVFDFDIYDVDKYGDDGDGGQAIIYSCVDKDGVNSGVRLRKDRINGLQIYIDYRGYSIVYNATTTDNVNNLFPSQYEFNQHIVTKTREEAENGDALAMYNMGYYYQNGLYGLSKDYNYALRYYYLLKGEGVYLGYNQVAYINAYQGYYDFACSVLDDGIAAYELKGPSAYPWDWTIDNLYDSKGEILLMANKYEEAVPIYNRLRFSDDQKIAESEFIKKMDAYMKGSDAYASISKAWIEHNVYSNGKKGMRVHIKFTAYDVLNHIVGAVLLFRYAGGTVLKDYNGQYTNSDGSVSCLDIATAKYKNPTWDDFVLFFPYSELHMASGCQNVKLAVDVGIFDWTASKWLTKSDAKVVPFNFSN